MILLKDMFDTFSLKAVIGEINLSFLYERRTQPGHINNVSSLSRGCKMKKTQHDKQTKGNYMLVSMFVF